VTASLENHMKHQTQREQLMKLTKLTGCIILAGLLTGSFAQAAEKTPPRDGTVYPDGRQSATLRMEAKGPCWPKEQDARFTNLRAQGGFLVSAAQKDGKVTKLEITSTVGGTLRLLNPWTGKIVERATQPGERLAFTGKEE
jgi:hypothetical protein